LGLIDTCILLWKLEDGLQIPKNTTHTLMTE